MTTDIEPIERDSFDTERLMEEYPPVWEHRNKHAVFDIACPAGTIHAGRLSYTRWPALPLPAEVDPVAAAMPVERREHVYDYAASSDAPGAVEWHVNFPDPDLFSPTGHPCSHRTNYRSPNIRRSAPSRKRFPRTAVWP